jgi:membrane protein DedA with SNARE-associated domain
MRTVAALGLGMTRIAWTRFTRLNVVSAGLWAAIFIGAGYSLGHVSEAVLGEAANMATLGLLAVFALVFWLVGRRVQAAVR